MFQTGLNFKHVHLPILWELVKRPNSVLPTEAITIWYKLYSHEYIII